MKVFNRAGFCLLALLLLFIAAVPVRADTSDVFTITPNGVDDTAALQAAFDAAKAAGPGSIVQLVEGEYFISRSTPSISTARSWAKAWTRRSYVLCPTWPVILVIGASIRF